MAYYAALNMLIFRQYNNLYEQYKNMFLVPYIVVWIIHLECEEWDKGCLGLLNACNKRSNKEWVLEISVHLHDNCDLVRGQQIYTISCIDGELWKRKIYKNKNKM